MSKRLRNKRGRQGRGKRNPQYCKERGMVLAKKMRKRQIKELLEKKDDPTGGFFS